MINTEIRLIIFFAAKDGITDSVDMNLSKLQGMVKYRGACCAKVNGITKSCT